MLDCAPLALEASKQVMLQSVANPISQPRCARPIRRPQRMLASEDAKEGPRAFAEKRKPQWRGR